MLSRQRARLNAAVLFLVLALSLLTGCAQQGDDIPRYPGARYLHSEQMSGKTELDKATVYVAAYETPDYIDEVGAFYTAKMADKAGWTGGFSKGADYGGWTDGNIVATDRTLSNYKPKDPSKPGGLVGIYKKEGGCFIQIVTSVPKK
ncbi:MAG: hypothetical protein AB1758_21765 [Candidatus Eremiobacterota bacterium]